MAKRGNHSAQSPAPYKIGYGRPPVHSRFKPGQSGNRKGRPKGRRNVRTVVEEALNQRITIREGDRTRSRSKLEGLVLTMLNKALQGDVKTQTAVIHLIRSVGMTEEIPKPTSSEPVTVHDGEIITDFLRRHGVSGAKVAAPEKATESRDSTPSNKGPKP